MARLTKDAMLTTNLRMSLARVPGHRVASCILAIMDLLAFDSQINQPSQTYSDAMRFASEGEKH